MSKNYKIQCLWYIADGIIYYKTLNGRVYQREMIPEIDRIINTMRPVRLTNGVKRFEKLVYENELVSINQYIIGTDKVFKLLPPYRAGTEIIRFRGDVPMTVNGKPAKQPTYASPEYAAYLREQKRHSDAPDAVKQKRQKRLAYLREYQRRRYNEKKQQSNNNQNSKKL